MYVCETFKYACECSISYRVCVCDDFICVVLKGVCVYVCDALV